MDNVIPWTALLVFVGAFLLFLFIRKPVGPENQKETHYKCTKRGTSAARCIPSQDPSNPITLEECKFTCPVRPYWACASKTVAGMKVRTGDCISQTSIETPYTDQQSCEQKAECSATQYFRCDPVRGCVNSTFCSTCDNYTDPQVCLKECRARHRCDGGVCTDIGHNSQGTSGSCAAADCSDDKYTYVCDTGVGGCSPLTDKSGKTIGDCIASCCKNPCGNVCCEEGNECCVDSRGKPVGCFQPECERCLSSGDIVSTCATTCSTCKNGKCLPQQCEPCETCVAGVCMISTGCSCCRPPGCAPFCATPDNPCQGCPTLLDPLRVRNGKYPSSGFEVTTVHSS